ncbi:MAG: hypothetical protein ACKOD7_03600 [Polynucleobacter victoriensis]
MRNLLISALFLAIASASYAGDKTPNLVGEWVAQAEASVYGASGHNPASGHKPAFRDRTLVLTYIIEEQQGRSFYGQIVSDNYSERMVGSIAADGKTGAIADEDGTYQLKIVNKNRIEYCYTQTTKESLVAGCNTMIRK